MPSTLLDAQNITRVHGARTVLDGVDLRVTDADRLAVVGPNGAGKSTLLRIAAGLEPADGGRVLRHGSVGYLPQTHPEGAATVGAHVLERTGVGPAERALDGWARRLEGGDLDATEPHAAALEHWLALGGPDAEARLLTALDGLGLDAGLRDRPLGALSGGQAARVGLAALEVLRTDIVLLDEPTNHLDADGLERLRALIAARGGGVVLVSHDRAVLRETASDVLDLDRHTGRGTRWSGGWDAYERERSRARRAAEEAYETAVAEQARVKAVETEVRRRAEASRNNVEKTAADGDKYGKEWVRMRADEKLSRARKIGTRAERVEVPDKPWRPPAAWLALDVGGRGRAGVRLHGAILRRGAWSLGPLDLAVEAGERVLLTGANGTGKSTLLAAIAGELPLAAGARRAAPGTVVATLGQARGALLAVAADGDDVSPAPSRATAAAAPGADAPPDRSRAATSPDPPARRGAATLTSAVRALTGVDVSAARTALAGFGLGPDAALRAVGSLSPGELTRAELTVASLREANLLLLDEPTNHLDLESLETLEAALEAWPGALVVATHDAELRARLRVDREVAL